MIRPYRPHCVAFKMQLVDVKCEAILLVSLGRSLDSRYRLEGIFQLVRLWPNQKYFNIGGRYMT